MTLLVFTPHWITYNIQEHSHWFDITPIWSHLINHYGGKPSMVITVNEPVESKQKNIVLHLGSFHTEMSFLDTLHGHLMAASGLWEALEQVYAPNAVVRILNGKAIARTLQGHFIQHLILWSWWTHLVSTHQNAQNSQIKKQRRWGYCKHTMIPYWFKRSCCSLWEVNSRIFDHKWSLWKCYVQWPELMMPFKGRMKVWKFQKQQHCGYSTWSWITFFADILQQSVLAIWIYIFKLFPKCFLLWQLQDTTITLSHCMSTYSNLQKWSSWSLSTFSKWSTHNQM